MAMGKISRGGTKSRKSKGSTQKNAAVVTRKRKKMPNMLASSVLRGGAFSTFPAMLKCKMRYTDIATLTSVSGSFATRVYRINSPYDPDKTGAGHQPRYYDTLLGASASTAPYNKYAIYKAKILVRASSGTTSTSTGTVAVMPYVVGIPTTMDEMLESPGTSSRVINTLGAGDRCVAALGNYVDIAKFLNIDPSGEDNLGAYNGNPNVAPEWLVAFADDLGNSSAVKIRVTITYYAMLTHLNQVAES